MLNQGLLPYIQFTQCFMEIASFAFVSNNKGYFRTSGDRETRCITVYYNFLSKSKFTKLTKLLG